MIGSEVLLFFFCRFHPKVPNLIGGELALLLPLDQSDCSIETKEIFHTYCSIVRVKQKKEFLTYRVLLFYCKTKILHLSRFRVCVTTKAFRYSASINFLIFKSFYCHFHSIDFFSMVSRYNIIKGIYHGCFTKNADGTNQIILTGKRCFLPNFQTLLKISWGYWERWGQNTQSNKKVAAAACDKKSLQKILWKQRANSSKDNSTRFGSLRHEIYRLFLRCLVIVMLLFFIVNNRNF